MEKPGVELNERQKKARDARNTAIAWALVAFVVIVFVGTMAKLGPNILIRPL